MDGSVLPDIDIDIDNYFRIHLIQMQVAKLHKPLDIDHVTYAI
jgi:hypothetical protein